MNLDGLRFLWHCWKFYCSGHDAALFQVLRHGVPAVTVFIARGREAWQADEMAVHYFAGRLKPPSYE